MNEGNSITVKYEDFDTAKSTMSTLKDQLSTKQDTISTCKNNLQSESIFMGPVAENCVEAANSLGTSLNTAIENLTTLQTTTDLIRDAYKNSDTATVNKILGIASTISLSGEIVSTVTIPDSVTQRGYTVTCYGVGGWYLSAKSTPTKISASSRQKKVHNVWLENGAKYKNGIATINIDGVDHYLVATASKLGKVGDKINVKLKNGQTIPCVVADAKSSGDKNYDTYGHKSASGKVNVLEFEVDREVFIAKGRSNPTTEKWGLEWDSSSGVASVDNYGSII